MSSNNSYPQFFTCTALEWKHLLQNDELKDIIVSSLRFLVRHNRIKLYSFVIMPNHFHLIWQMQGDHQRKDVQRDFLKYTSQKIKAWLKQNNPLLLAECKVDAVDREYQLWERNPLSFDIYNLKTFLQKLEYIHNNPVQEKWALCQAPEHYQYSSAKMYIESVDQWDFLSHFQD